MSDLIFTIEQVFSTDTRTGVLGKNDAYCYYIPPYQRGYKWKSEGTNAWVRILLKDLLEAINNEDEEYYLQYVTLKRVAHLNEMKALELIDGQQRITTLLILLSVLSYRLGESSDSNIAKNKLIYGTRNSVHDFIKGFIQTNIHTVLETNWDDFISAYPIFDEQDIYYIFHAANKINSMLPQEQSKITAFSLFVKNKVRLIINLIEDRISSERIFSNLNSNRVELMNGELVKGLLLTKSARQFRAGKSTYRELLEIRTMMGKQWDDISRWANQPEVKSFYFSLTSSPMEQFLELVAKKQGFKCSPTPDKYELFEFYQSKLKKGDMTPRMLFSKAKVIYSILKDWYNTNDIYNRLGFVLFAKDMGISDTFFIDLLTLPKIAVKSALLKNALSAIPPDVGALEYGVNTKEIRIALLSLSVFLDENAFRFNFHKFSNENWSLEHIFPQNPDQLPSLLQIADIMLLNSLLSGDTKKDYERLRNSNESVEDVINLCAGIETKLQQQSCTIADREKELLCQMIRSDKLNSIGNLALLTCPDNSSNSNGMFDYKRINISNKVSNGSFVPKHTYDVFSKLISSEMNKDLTVWTEADIVAHSRWIVNKISAIRRLVA